MNLLNNFISFQFITFKDGKIGVNFAGYHASAGLGGLLTGDAAHGGLSASAGTPFGKILNQSFRCQVANAICYLKVNKLELASVDLLMEVMNEQTIKCNLK